MVSDLGTNAKYKCYPDGSIVATYCSMPVFNMIPQHKSRDILPFDKDIPYYDSIISHGLVVGVRPSPLSFFVSLPDPYTTMATYKRFFWLLNGQFEAYTDELTSIGKSDDEIATLCGVRWSYLFPQFTYFDWSQMLSIYRDNPDLVRFWNLHKFDC